MGTKLSGLGKGLDEIFTENQTENNKSFYVNLSNIEPNKGQPRKEFSAESLNSLADSILNYGILQPLLVKPIAETDSYQIIAGERRWRAARIANLKEIPVIVKELTEKEQAEIALVENLQREDLSPLEEAKGYKCLIDFYGLTQEQVAQSVGKSRSVITNAIRLLSLPESVKEKLKAKEITVGHAKILLSLKTKEQIINVCNLIIEKRLSVRDLEKLCKQLLNERPFSKNTKKQFNSRKDPFISDIEISLKKALGRNVFITHKSASKGILQLEFYNDKDLLNLIRAFGVQQ